ncbi:MAG TPA: hypothetical protein VKS21_08065, partial [Spirochaetota bacterium]|nr:hypothetical protein [Spirochaetota bacterium]
MKKVFLYLGILLLTAGCVLEPPLTPEEISNGKGRHPAWYIPPDMPLVDMGSRVADDFILSQMV